MIYSICYLFLHIFWLLCIKNQIFITWDMAIHVKSFFFFFEYKNADGVTCGALTTLKAYNNIGSLESVAFRML